MSEQDVQEHLLNRERARDLLARVRALEAHVAEMEEAFAFAIALKRDAETYKKAMTDIQTTLNEAVRMFSFLLDGPASAPPMEHANNHGRGVIGLCRPSTPPQPSQNVFMLPSVRAANISGEQQTDARRSPPRFIINAGPQRGVSLTLTDGDIEYTIGGSPHCSITITDSTVALTHATVRRGAQGIWLRVVRGAPSVRVNDATIEPLDRTALTNGDVLRIGATTLLFLDPDADHAHRTPAATRP